MIETPFLNHKKCKFLMLSRSTTYHEAVNVVPSKDEINIKNTIDCIHFEESAYRYIVLLDIKINS